MADLDRRHIRDAARDMQREFEKTGDASARGLSTAFDKHMPKVEKSLDKATAASGRFLVEQQKLQTMIAKGNVDRDRLIRQSERVAVAYRKESAALRLVNDDMLRSNRNTEESFKGVITQVNNLGSSTRFLGRGLGTIGLPVFAMALANVAKGAVTASQSIALLPAAVTAAGAAFGTLKLATMGFGDAIKDIGDPEKFAEALQKLSPNAQQAALSIQALMPSLTQLKNATQDAFFADMGAQIERLTTQYLPAVQQMTTGIASAFNEAGKGIVDQLMTPDTQAALQTTMANIAQSFRELAPAAAPLAKAFADITAVGSGFLPELARGATDAARAFADFISEARASGELQQFIRDGIDAVKAFTTAVWDLGGVIYKVFGSDGQANVEGFKDTLYGLNVAIATVGGDFSFLSADIQEEFAKMTGPAAAFRDAVLDIPEALVWVGNKAIDMANAVKGALDSMGRNAANFYNSIPLLPDSAQFTPLPDIPHIPSGGDWGGYTAPGQPAPRPGQGGTPTGRERRGLPPLPPGATPVPGRPWGGPYGVPPPPPDGGKVSESERREQIRAGLDPNQFAVDANAPLPPVAPGVPQGSGPGQFVVDQQQVVEAQQRVQSEAWDLQDARMDLAVLERDTLATQQELTDARRKVQEEEWQWQNAQVDLAEAQQGTFKELADSSRSFSKGMGEIGAALDQDLGISRGLPGIAENLVKFAASMAAAPLLGRLAAVQSASPSQGGHGLLGIMGAQGAFGPNFTGIDYTQTTGYADPMAATSSTAPLSLGSVPKSKFSDSGLVPAAAQLNDIIPALFPSVTEIGGYRQDPHPDHPSGRALDIMIPGGTTRGGANPQGKMLGDQMWDFLMGTGVVDPQGSLWRTDTGGDHYNHIHARIAEGMENAAVQAGLIPGGGSSYGSASLGGGSIPIPLPVTIVGAGASPSALGPAGLQPPGVGAAAGAGLGSSLYQDASGRWHSRLPGWDQLIQRESSGINQRQGITDANSGGNEAEGLFQITPQTWAAHGGTQYAPSALGATAQEQAAIAQAIFGANPTGSDWGMGLPGRENPAQLGAELGAMAGGQMPGMGMPQSMPMGMAPASPIKGGGNFGITPGGTIDTAINMAAGGLDMLAPGAGQAASTGIKLANRAIQYGAQVAGIGVSGLMETFLPSESPLGNIGNSWLGRIVGGIAGAAPALPNAAGNKQQQQQDPNTAQHGQGGGPPGPPVTNNVTVNNNRQNEDGTGRDISRHLTAMYSPVGGR